MQNVFYFRPDVCGGLEQWEAEFVRAVVRMARAVSRDFVMPSCRRFADEINEGNLEKHFQTSQVGDKLQVTTLTGVAFEIVKFMDLAQDDQRQWQAMLFVIETIENGELDGRDLKGTTER